MPRLTYWPSSSSCAARAASSLRVRAMSRLRRVGAGRRGRGGARAGAGGAELDLLALDADLDDALHVDPGEVDVVGADLARLDELLDLGDGDPPGHAGQRVEVPRGLVEDQVAV